MQVLLTCDICGGDKPGTETVAFGFDGGSYDIDVCDKHAKQLRDGVQQFVSAGRRVSGGRSTRRGRSSSRGASDRQRIQAIREWARKKGIAVSERGRLSGDIIAQYEASGGK